MKLIHQVIKIRSIRTSSSLINKLNNMETKELKIQAPEGYEIDKENSTFECIRFKLIKKNITYDDVCNSMLKTGYYIDNRGKILHVTEYVDNAKIDKNNATNKEQLERLLALNQLLNIAEYYNKNTPKLDVRYRIYYDKSIYSYKTAHYTYYSNKFSIEAFFNREEDAQAVINNPNFQEILDTIYKG